MVISQKQYLCCVKSLPRCLRRLSQLSESDGLNEGLSSRVLTLSSCPLLCGEDTFTSHVLQVLQRDVKFGETVSYKRLAEMAGNPRAVRAVGGAMRKNPVSAADID